MTNTGCLCEDGCISAYDNQPCDCFCDGDLDGKHHYDYLEDGGTPVTSDQEWGARRSPEADAKLRRRMTAITRNKRGDYDRSIERWARWLTFYDRMPRALRRLVPRRFV